MSRRKRFSVAATTAFVAALPVFPHLADAAEPTNDAKSQTAVAKIDDAKSQTVVAKVNDAKPQTGADAFVLPDLNAAFADFNVALFEIPDGESVEFYRKRAAELEGEWSKFCLPYQNALENAARASGAPQEFTALAFSMFPRTIPTPTGFVNAPADSIPTRYAAALAATLRRLIDSPELPPEVRGRYYADWTSAAASPLGERPLVKLRDFYAQLLADEKARPEPNLGRVRYLSERFGSVENRVKHGVGILDCLETPQSFDLAELEKLIADRPKEERVELYQERLQKLFAAEKRARDAGASDDVISLIRKNLNSTSYLLNELERKAVAALDVDAVKELFDVPQGESGAFYIERYNKTQKIANDLHNYCNAGICDLRDVADRLFDETLPTLARRIAYADDLPPLDRFEYFVRWLNSCDVEEMQAALETETARDATSPIDRARGPFVEYRLLETRLKHAVAEARKALPESERYRSTPLETSISPELEATFAELFSEIAERSDDGALPWELNRTWAEQASYLARVVESVGTEYATQFRKEICAVLADSENETNRLFLQTLQRQIRNEELKTRFDGFPVEISGANLDGTPFDWASYRGAPTLIEIVRVDFYGVPQNRESLDVATLDEYVQAGLRRVRYVAAPLEIALKFAEQVRSAARPTSSDGAETSGAADANNVVATPERYAVYNDAVPVVAPTNFYSNWIAELNADVDWVLVDADGKTLAAFPKRPKNRDDAPEIGDALKRLFPNAQGDAGAETK